ncbi:hypothetical protein AAC387_Pa09g0648 [Persea americana]
MQEFLLQCWTAVQRTALWGLLECLLILAESFKTRWSSKFYLFFLTGSPAELFPLFSRAQLLGTEILYLTVLESWMIVHICKKP